jgi:hypothetical protein
MKVSWDYEIPNIWKNKTCSKPPTSILSSFPTVSNQSTMDNSGKKGPQLKLHWIIHGPSCRGAIESGPNMEWFYC